MLVAVIPTSVFALTMGCKKHQRYRLLLWGISGLILMVLAILLGHDLIGEGFNSVGWRFSPDIVFAHNKLLVFLNKVHAERIKAVFNTEEGVFGYNVTGNERSDDERAKNEVSTGGFTETTLNTIEESRIEIIANTIAESLEAELLACIINKAEITEV